MKFKFIKEVDSPVNAYDGSKVMTGDIVDLSDHLSEKALKNPDYEQMSDITQNDGSEVFVERKTTKKKPGRPKKKI